MKSRSRCFSFLLPLFLVSTATFGQTERWSEENANLWYETKAWPVGSNYLPADASNQLEMWQADTFNPAQIDRELGWAHDTGMNTMRVFLHDLVWENDAEGLLARMRVFLTIAEKHGIRPMFVFFDSVWDPLPKSGVQAEPRPGVHNSRWVQSPGILALQSMGLQSALKKSTHEPRLTDYVQGVIRAFRDDPRILAWDLWNEPDNLNGGSYDDPVQKHEWVEHLLPKVFAWARAADPSQPLTSGVWGGDWSSDFHLSPIQRTQLELSDVITFHNYDDGVEYAKRIGWLRRYHRPILCTEYMARPRMSTFASILPIAKAERVGSYNWGFVQGKSQTFIPWDSWQTPYRTPPKVWFHDLFYTDGRPYRPEEITLIRELTESRATVQAGSD